MVAFNYARVETAKPAMGPREQTQASTRAESKMMGTSPSPSALPAGPKVVAPLILVPTRIGPLVFCILSRDYNDFNPTSPCL